MPLSKSYLIDLFNLFNIYDLQVLYEYDSDNKEHETNANILSNAIILAKE